MAKNDFLVGLLQGLYQGGVGNPEVNEKRRLLETANEQNRFQMQKQAQDMGMIAEEVHPDTGSIIDKVRSVMFPGSGGMRMAFKPDPNAPVPFVDATGKPGIGLPGTKLSTGQFKYPLDKTIGLMQKDESQALMERRLAALEAERGIKHDEALAGAKTKVVDKFNADKDVVKAQQSLSAAGDIFDLATSGNPIAAGSIPTFSARMSGEVGNLSEADKRPFGGSQAIVNRIGQAFSEMSTGQLSPQNKQFVIDLTRIIKKRASEKMDLLAKSRSRQYSAADRRLKSNELYEMLRPSMEEETKKATHRWNPITGKVEALP